MIYQFLQTLIDGRDYKKQFYKIPFNKTMASKYAYKCWRSRKNISLRVTKLRSQWEQEA